MPQERADEQKQSKGIIGDDLVSLLHEYQRDQSSRAITDQAIKEAAGALRASNHKRHCQGKPGGGLISISDLKIIDD